MNIPLIKTSIFTSGRVDLSMLLRKAAWVSIVSLSFVYSITGTQDNLLGLHTTFDRWLYGYLNFMSFVLGVAAGLFIFLRKPASWMAFTMSVMLVTFTATDGGIRFWYLWQTGVSFSVGAANDTIPYTISLFAHVLYMALLTISLAYVLLVFPGEQLPSRNVRRFFQLLVASQVLSIVGLALLFRRISLGAVGSGYGYEVFSLLEIGKAFLLMILAYWQVHRLQTTTDPVQSKQIAWIVVSLIGMTVFYALGSLALAAGDMAWMPWGYFLPLLVCTYGFIITLPIAMLRYRLWDIKRIYNQGAIYIGVSISLGVIGAIAAALLELMSKQTVESNSEFAVVMLFLTGLFHPLWQGVRKTVDHYVKPEEVDFSSAIVEFSPDAQLMLSSREILNILVRQSVEQLNLAGAAIYFKAEDGQLTQSEPAAPDPELPPLRLDDKTRATLERGDVVEPPEQSPHSLLIPLMVKRAAKHQFLGVLALGRRSSGEGYPTQVRKSLKKLGCDAGKTIYIAQLREHLGRDIMTRLSAIERGLSTLDKTAA